MNKDRRKELDKAIGLIEEASSIIDNCLREETDARDNMSENLQGSERYEKMDSAVSELEECISNLESALANIETAKE